MKAVECDVVMLSETKGHPPLIAGYTWYSKTRETMKGGGVAIGVKNDVAKYATRVKNLEDQQQEIVWVELAIPRNNKYYLGCFYGPQERESKEEVERQYSQLETQIQNNKKEGNIVLMGDFNAKLAIQCEKIEQKESRNGRTLKNITNTSLRPANTDPDVVAWTRVNRKNTEERSVIDYILTCEETRKHITDIEIDEAGSLRLKGYENESDHNTMTISIHTKKNHVNKKIKKWKLGNEAGWKEFNKKMTSTNMHQLPKTYEENLTRIKEILEETIGRRTITVKPGRGKHSEELKRLKANRKEKKEPSQKQNQWKKVNAWQTTMRHKQWLENRLRRKNKKE
jgi:hypothetical protein